MYNARIDTDLGRSAFFGYEHGVLFDIEPLSGIPVNIATSQGFQQVGQTVENQSVSGIVRNISGKVLNDTSAQFLIEALPVFTKGKLWVNDKYFCEIHVNHSPEFKRSKNGDLRFTMSVFCATPFWFDGETKSQTIIQYRSYFNFPVNYDTHKFGEQIVGDYVNIRNVGLIDTPMRVTFFANSTVQNFQIENIATGEVLQIEEELAVGETITMYHSQGRILLEKQTAYGEKIDIFYALSDESNLFWLHPGDNYYRKAAASGENVLNAIISYNAPYMGVIV